MFLTRFTDFPVETYIKEYGELGKLWIYRAMIKLGVQNALIDRKGFDDDRIAHAIGLGHWIDPEDREFDRALVQKELNQLYLQAESNKECAFAPSGLEKNINNLSILLGLNETSRHILKFSILLHTSYLLEEVFDMMGSLSTNRLYHILSVILDINETDIKSALSKQGQLSRTGLVSIDHKNKHNLSNKIDILSCSLAGNMLNESDDPFDLLKEMFSLCDAPGLTFSDFDHIKNSLDILLPYLRDCIKDQRKGVNIFIYGIPGTGKSQLSRVIAKELGCNLFEVAREDNDGDPISGDRRLRSVRTAQHAIEDKSALLLFDEVEDIFGANDDLWGIQSPAQSHKGWLNQTLENNPIPTFWLTNSIDDIDAAFIRRFDMVFELPIPARRQRQQIIAQVGKDILPEPVISRLAQSDNLAPAVVTRATDVVARVQDHLGSRTAPDAVEHLINNTLQAQGHAPIQSHDINALPSGYNPDFINSTTDLGQLTEGLRQFKQGRLCLYGPPGTGKTAFARWLAEQFDMPLLVKRGSDLLSKWIGQTEQNMARAFREASNDGALLLIDEVDSFLQDRRGAQRSWEVTEVNEMLTQMESFPGLFIASTNLMDNLDQAALRRFDLKLHFDYLNSDQRWRLFCHHIESLELDCPDEHLRQRLADLEQLTPGDFAAVVRQHRFRPISSAEILLTALEDECQVKEGGRQRRIGFV